jgi:hypothetical protein
MDEQRGAVVCVAVNGYDRVYRWCVRSHASYAERYGFDYVLAKAKGQRVERHDAAWLKIELLTTLLERGVPWVFLVDSDAVLTKAAPSMTSLEKNEKDIYAARGRSGRWNSGVLIVKNTPGARKVVEGIRKSALVEVPEKHWNGWTDWGENAHVIHALDRYDGVEELDLRWNNTIDAKLNDFVRHYTGPLSVSEKWMVKRRKAAANRVSGRLPVVPGDRDERLEELVSGALLS